MSIRLDVASRTALAICSCGWRALRGTKEAARAAGLDHEAACHPTSFAFRRAGYMRDARRAAGFVECDRPSAGSHS